MSDEYTFHIHVVPHIQTQGCDLTFFSHQGLLLNHEFSLPINNNIESRANESAKFHI